MDIESILNKVKFNLKQLQDYGFILIDNEYIYSTYIMNDEFRVDISIFNNKLKSKIIDNQTNEEYYSIYVKDNIGEYVGKVREQYYSVIKDIVDKCSSKELFNYKQTNRIASYIILKYNIKPEFLWDKTPDCAVFRHKTNNKWFSIIMNINKQKLDKKTNKEIEIINLKQNPLLIEELIKHPGFYKAYHMNGKYWITITLDDTLSDKLIIELIDKSFILTK